MKLFSRDPVRRWGIEPSGANSWFRARVLEFLLSKPKRKFSTSTRTVEISVTDKLYFEEHWSALMTVKDDVTTHSFELMIAATTFVCASWNKILPFQISFKNNSTLKRGYLLLVVTHPTLTLTVWWHSISAVLHDVKQPSCDPLYRCVSLTHKHWIWKEGDHGNTAVPDASRKLRVLNSQHRWRSSRF